MRKLLFIIAVLLSFGAKAQTFTPIHNYQAPDGVDVVKFFGIPHGETPTLNGVNRPGGHPLYYKTTDSSLYLYSGSQWIRVGGGNGNKDTVLVDEGLGVRFDSLGKQHLFAIHPDGYEGGVVTYAGTGFDFNVSPITLYLSNKVFQFPSTTLTLSPPNSQPRYDIFGVDSLGAFVKSGDTAAVPVEPQVGIDSFALTKAFLISPGDTAPSNITTVIIYDQNAEWTTGTQGSISVVDFDNTDNPLHLTKDIFISKYNNNSKIYFVNGSYVSTENTPQSVLLLPIYLNSALPANNNIYIRLYDTLTSSTNLYRLGSNDNFNKNEVNAYQTVVIPTSNLTWINNKSTFTSLLVTFSGYDTSGAKGLYMDYIRLQKGIQNIPSPTDYSNKQDSNYKRNDSLFWVAKGIEHFITKVGTCDTCISTVNISADSTLMYFIRVNGDTARAVDFYGGGGSYQLPYNGNSTDYLGGDTAYHPLPITDTSNLSDRIDLKLNITDTTGKWFSWGYKSNDSVFLCKNSTCIFIYKDSTGGGGGGVSQSVISDTLNNYANSGSITTDNVIYSTPIALSVANHLISGAFALKSQSAYTLFGNNTSSSTTPVFFTNNFSDSLRIVSGIVSRRVNGNWYPQYYGPRMDSSFIRVQADGIGAPNYANNIVKGLWLANTSTGNQASPAITIEGNRTLYGKIYVRQYLDPITNAYLMQASPDSVTWYKTMSVTQSGIGIIAGLGIYGNSGTQIFLQLGGDGYVTALLGVLGLKGGNISYEASNLATGANAHNFKGTFGLTGNQIFGNFLPVVNKTSGSYEGLRINATETALGSDTNYLFRAGTGGATFASKYNITNKGQVGIGADVLPPANTVFKIASTTQTSHPFPNMTAAQMAAITSPNVGDHVYQTDGTEGVYVYKSDSTWHFAY